MNDVKRKYGIAFGAIAITLLLITSATALPARPKLPVESSDNKTYNIDPDIYLTTEKLSMLYESLEYIDNSNVYQLVEGIIDEIEEKGCVNSDDIQGIEDYLGLSFSVHVGWINSGGRGAAHCFPGEILPIPFPSIVVVWDGDYDDTGSATTSINGIERYSGDHSGFIIGFFGYVWTGAGSSGRPQYSVIGLCTLIIVDDPGDNSQSDTTKSIPQSLYNNVVLH